VSDATILPVRPGTLSAKDKRALSAAGVVVVEHENPAEVRLLRPAADLDSSAMLLCAMRALSKLEGASAKEQRELFSRLVLAELEAKHGR